MTKIYNLALGGTGVDGTAFAGALRQFNYRTPGNSLKDIKRVVGCGTGALIAMMIALKFSVEEIEKVCHEDLTVDKMEYKDVKKSSCAYDGDQLEVLIKRLLRLKTGNENFTFNDLDEKKDFKQLYIITTMLYQQEGTPKTNRHVFNKEHTGRTRIRDAVLASASVPGMYPIVFLNKEGDNLWRKGDEFHHIPGGLEPSPMEEFFDKKEFTHLEDDKTHLPYNPDTLAIITHNNAPSTAPWLPIATDQPAKLLYSLTSSASEDLIKDESSKLIYALTIAQAEDSDQAHTIQQRERKHKRTVYVEIKHPTNYGNHHQKRHAIAAGEIAVRDHYTLFPVAEEKPADRHDTHAQTDASPNPSGLFSRSRRSILAEEKPKDAKEKKCAIM